MRYGITNLYAIHMTMTALQSEGFLLGRRETVFAILSVLPTPPTTPNPSSYNFEAVNQDLLAAFGESLHGNQPMLAPSAVVAPKPTNDSSEGKNLAEALRDVQREKQIGPTSHGK